MPYKILAICGSLQKNSTNSGILRACVLANNKELDIQIADISQFPHFNMDIILDLGYPEPVQIVRDLIVGADAVLFASPQHNTKVSAAFKNMYDWVSFTANPEKPSPIRQKPAALIVCSESNGIKAQQHFKRMCEYCKVQVLPKSLLIKKSGEDFDQNGNLTNADKMHEVDQFLKYFVQHIKKTKK